MKLTKITAIVLGIVIIILLVVLIFIPAVKGPTTAPGQASSSTTSTDETGQASSSAMVSADGHLEVYLPGANDAISSPVAVEGAVTGGGWFFEASFPVKVLDGDGSVIGQGTAQALSDWTSTGTVPFSASISFTAPHYATGTVMLQNDNPSGAPQNAKSLSIPVMFENASGSGVSATINDTGTGTVQGKVVLGPTCPVETIPPSPQCAPKAYQTSIAISRNLENFTAITTIPTDSSGVFKVSLAAGEYDFRPQGGSPYPRCSEELVTVTAGAVSTTTITCDTGIR